MEHYFTQFRDYICTANADGSVPLNSKVVCELLRVENPDLLTNLLGRANLAKELVDAINTARLEAPEITSALRRYGFR